MADSLCPEFLDDRFRKVYIIYNIICMPYKTLVPIRKLTCVKILKMWKIKIFIFNSTGNTNYIIFITMTIWILTLVKILRLTQFYKEHSGIHECICGIWVRQISKLETRILTWKDKFWVKSILSQLERIILLWPST